MAKTTKRPKTGMAKPGRTVGKKTRKATKPAARKRVRKAAGDAVTLPKDEHLVTAMELMAAVAYLVDKVKDVATSDYHALRSVMHDRPLAGMPTILETFETALGENLDLWVKMVRETEPPAAEPSAPGDGREIKETGARLHIDQGLREHVGRETGVVPDDATIREAVDRYAGWPTDGVVQDEKDANTAYNALSSRDGRDAVKHRGVLARTALAVRGYAHPASTKTATKEYLSTGEVLAVAGALGRDVEDVDPAEVLKTYNEWANDPTDEIQVRMTDREADFQANGGRGIELADEIDMLRSVLAVRHFTGEHWPADAKPTLTEVLHRTDVSFERVKWFAQEFDFADLSVDDHETIIVKHLLTPEQKDTLNAAGLSVRDVMTDNYEPQHLDLAHKILADWDDRLETK